MASPSIKDKKRPREPDDATTGRPAKNRRIQSNFGDFVSFTYKNATYSAHKDIICKRSKHIKGLCEERDGGPYSLSLAGIGSFSPQALKAYIEHLYYPETDLTSRAGESAVERARGAYEVTSNHTFAELLGFWRLGDNIRDATYQNAVMDALIGIYGVFGDIFVKTTVPFISKYGSKTYGLRKWLIDSLTFCVQPEEIRAATKEWPQDVFHEVMERIVADARSDNKSQKPTIEDCHKYHEQED